MRSPRTSGGLSLSEARRRSPSVLVVALSSALALACFASAPALTASAQPSLAVTSNLDFPKLAGSNAVCASTAPGNPCTLRAAIETVNAGFDPGAEITLPASAFVLTLNPVRGPLDATASMSIIGHGAGQSVIDGNRQTGVLQVEAAATVTVTGLSILHGEGFYGGGIFSGGTLTLNGVTVAFNHAAHGGGIATFGAGLTMRGGSVTSNVAIVFGGGMLTAGPAAITATTVSSNQSAGGGGIASFGGTLALTGVTISGNAGPYGGGGIALGVGNVPGAATISDSTISGNTSLYVGTHGGVGGGIVAVSTTLTINRSTVTGNAAGAAGGGIAVGHSTLALTNDTITRNTAPLGGGILQVATGATVNPGGATAHESLLQLPAATAGLLLSRPAPATRAGPHVAPPARPNEVTVNSSTVAENTATTGGGIVNQGGLLVGAHDTIVALNRAPTATNCSGVVTSAGYNIESRADCAFTGTGDQQNTDPRLSAPAGTPLETLAPLAGSPAIDTGDPACPPPATDELGTARPQGPRCDVGAVEVPQAAVLVPAPPATGRG